MRRRLKLKRETVLVLSNLQIVAVLGGVPNSQLPTCSLCAAGCQPPLR